MVTGVTPKGVFVRIVDPPVEGRLMRGEQGLDVGDRLHVRLLSTDPQRGLHRFREGVMDGTSRNAAAHRRDAGVSRRKALRGAPAGVRRISAPRRARARRARSWRISATCSIGRFRSPMAPKNGKIPPVLSMGFGDRRASFRRWKRSTRASDRGEPLGCSPEQLFQGPVADALTHVGQIAMLRRMAGVPIKGENYFKADIQVGTVSSQQPLLG